MDFGQERSPGIFQVEWPCMAGACKDRVIGHLTVPPGLSPKKYQAFPAFLEISCFLGRWGLQVNFGHHTGQL